MWQKKLDQMIKKKLSLYNKTINLWEEEEFRKIVYRTWCKYSSFFSLMLLSNLH